MLVATDCVCTVADTNFVCPFTAGSKPSWTAKLAGNQELLCSKIREEAGELCETLEQQEGQERAASEMADLLYHSMVLLNVQVYPIALLFCCSLRGPVLNGKQSTSSTMAVLCVTVSKGLACLCVW